MKCRIKIKRDGTLEFLGAPPPGLKLPGATVRRRFSEIVPTNTALFVAFRILRFLCGEGERNKVAAWTRTWRCQWEAVILMGPHRGTRRRSYQRKRLIEWEHELWWEAHPLGLEVSGDDDDKLPDEL